MNWKDLKALDEQYMMQTCHRFPVDIDHAKGATLFDLEGRAYVDFLSGIAGNSLGYGNELWAEAIMEQTLKLGSASNLFYTQPCALLAEELCSQTGMANACFVSSAVEANALMMSLARAYSQNRYGPGRNTILMLQDASEPTNLMKFSEGQVSPPLMDAVRLVSTNMEDIQNSASQDVCAVVLELIQTEGSMDPLSRKFVHALAIYCAEQDWLLLVNEVKTGAGRTGTLFAFQQYGILPDVISFSSGISGGLPLGGIMANNRCKEVLSTKAPDFAYGANPICAAAALSVLKLLNEQTLAQVKEKGDYLRSGIESLSLPLFRQTHGAGLMVGVSLSDANAHTDIASLLADHGLLCLPTKEGLLFLPPLLVSKNELDHGLDIIKQALQ